MDAALTLDLVRTTEQAAIAAARWRGRGDEQAVDEAAAKAMRDALNQVAIKGRIVIGEGQHGVAPALYVNETVGAGGAAADVAVEALECITKAARGGPDALSVAAVSEPGGLFAAPKVYMDKISVGPGLPEGVIDLDAAPADNIRKLAKARGVPAEAITVCILDRPRHGDLIGAVREAGARVRLIGDGDIVGALAPAIPDSGIDLYLGVGGAPEGVLAAAALRGFGGQMQGRLALRTDDERALVRDAGIADAERKFGILDLAGGTVIFAATGVTTGPLLDGARLSADEAVTHSVVTRSSTGVVRWLRTHHRTAKAG